MSPKEIIKTPATRKRFLIGMSAGPFSCVAGNIIASYYLGAELQTAGITDSTDQLKAVGLPLALLIVQICSHRTECRIKCLVPSVRLGRYAHGVSVGPKAHGPHFGSAPRYMPIYNRRAFQDVCRSPRKRFSKPRIWKRCGDVPVPGILLHSLDTFALPLSPRGLFGYVNMILIPLVRYSF